MDLLTFLQQLISGLSLALLLVIIFCRRGLMGRREFSWEACAGIIGRCWSKALGKAKTPETG